MCMWLEVGCAYEFKNLWRQAMSRAPEQELQMVVNCLVWVLRPKLSSEPEQQALLSAEPPLWPLEFF